MRPPAAGRPTPRRLMTRRNRSSMVVAPGAETAPWATEPDRRRPGWRGNPGGEDRPVGRVLVTEEIADNGLDLLRAAGHEVEVRLDLAPDDLMASVGGVNALIIRSATKVTAEVHRGGGRSGRGRAGRASASTTSTSMRPPPAASWWSTPRNPTCCRRPSTRWPCSWPRPATSPRPTPRSPPAGGSGRAGRGSSWPTRCSAWSGWDGSASWSPSGRWPSACGSSPSIPTSRPSGPASSTSSWSSSTS